jgi:predicted kinase
MFLNDINTNKSKVVILVGPPLSGKDTFLNSNDFTNFTLISRDDILMSLHDNSSYSEAFDKVNQKEVDRLLNQKIQDSITEKENVVINMTNLSPKSRNKHLSKFPSNHYYKIAVVFPKLDLSDYINRNEGRLINENKFIPVPVIKNMIDNWVEVSDSEGFDTIIKL